MGNETGSGSDAKYVYVCILKVGLNHARGDMGITSPHTLSDEAHQPICANLRVWQSHTNLMLRLISFLSVTHVPMENLVMGQYQIQHGQWLFSFLEVSMSHLRVYTVVRVTEE